ncbi:MAG TPA: hypothetical protein VMH33_09980 [Solirubrobacterales bacterium]|nr:hypothetical protein [Solirubrobacterales bacterium]
MRRTAKLVIAVCALVLVTAVLGVATSSAATVFCSAAETNCSSTHVEPAGTYFDSTTSTYFGGTSFEFTAATNTKVHCSSSLMALRSTKKSGLPLEAESESSLAEENCSIGLSGHACTKFSVGNAPATVTPTSGGSGVATIGTESQPLTISFECETASSGQVACTYKASGVQLKLAAERVSGWSRTSIGAVMTRVSQTKGASGLCQSIAVLAVSGIDYYPEVYFSSGSPETVFCSKAETSCSAANVDPVGTYFDSATSSYFSGTSFEVAGFGQPFPKISCNESLMALRSTAESGLPLEAESESSVVGENCFVSSSGPACTEFSLGNAPATVAATGGGSGLATIGTEGQPLTLSFECYTSKYEEEIACSYAVSGAQIKLTVEHEVGTTVFFANMDLVSQTKGTHACASSALVGAKGVDRSEPGAYFSTY